MLVVVAFVSQKGGVGKSTLARALATVAADAKIKVRVADLDAQQQTTARWEERREENSSGPFLDVVAYRSALEAVQGSLGKDQLLIIDAPARASKGTLEIARRADLVVQPSGAGIDDLDPAILVFHELAREGVPRDRLVLALSRIANKAEESAARAYVEKAGYAVLPGAVPERAMYRDAHNRGRAVTEMGRGPQDPRTEMLMERLLAMITERVKARVLAANSRGKRGSAA